MTRTATAARLAAFYAAYFGTVGVWLPFWPVWLESQGLDPTIIGVVLAVGFWVRVPVSPLVARVADASGRRRRLMVLLGAAAAAGYAAFALARAPWHFIALAALTGAAFTVLVPLADSLTLARVRSDRIDYGRVRLWGSVAFIASSVTAGELLSESPADLILWLVVGGVGVTFLSCIGVPEAGRAPGRRASRGAALRLVTRRPYVLLVLASCLVQSSHAVYYGFGTLHWTRAGHSETVVGLLWAEGVVAEILLFFIGTRLTARFHPATLLAIGGVGGLLRWSVLATTTHPAALVGAQALHALTFASAHLGAMSFLGRAVPESLSATAQTIYSAAVGGLALGIGMSFAGVLYERFGGLAFLFGAALSTAGLLVALWLRAAWREERALV